MTFSKSSCLMVRKASSGPTDVLDDIKSKLFSLLDSQNFRQRPSKNTFLLNLILCLDFIFDLVFGFHRCSIKYLGVWMVSRDGCLKVAGSHKHSTAIVLERHRSSGIKNEIIYLGNLEDHHYFTVFPCCLVWIHDTHRGASIKDKDHLAGQLPTINNYPLTINQVTHQVWRPPCGQLKCDLSLFP